MVSCRQQVMVETQIIFHVRAQEATHGNAKKFTARNQCICLDRDAIHRTCRIPLTPNNLLRLISLHGRPPLFRFPLTISAPVIITHFSFIFKKSLYECAA